MGGLGAQATGRASTPAVARLAVRLAGRLAPGPSAPSSSAQFAWAYAAEHCRVSYLRGRFLAQGSLSVAGGRIHLEFVVDPADAAALGAWLGEIGLPASWRERRGRGVVTWKSADTVLAFLRRAGASTSTLELESRFVTRALHGELNRVINAETSNLRRSVVSAVRQTAAIERLAADRRLAVLPPGVRAVAHARREMPEATYGELAAALGVTRGVVQRALGRIEQLALGDLEDEPHAPHSRESRPR